MVYAIASTHGVNPGPPTQATTPPPTTHVGSSTVEATSSPLGDDQLILTVIALSMKVHPHASTTPTKRYRDSDQSPLQEEYFSKWVRLSRGAAS